METKRTKGTKKRKAKKVLFAVSYTLLQFTWGIVQNVIGGILFALLGRGKAEIYRGALVRRWNLSGSMTLGMFILMDRGHGEDVLAHEWGHTVQSVILGPLYLVVVGIPSLMWAGLPYFERYRRRKNRSYYWLYCEAWATRIGNRPGTTTATRDRRGGKTEKPV